MRHTAFRWSFAATAVSALLALSAPAWADDGLGADEITLKNGGMVRGTVITVEPGTKVVLMESGSSAPRTIPWAEVADVERGKYAEKGAGKTAAEPPADEDASDASASKTGVVRLHIDSNERVQLHEELDTAYATSGGYAVALTRGKVACTSPCDRVIDASRGQKFVVAGDGVPASEPFYLNDQAGETTVKVEPGSTGRRALGATLASLGIVGALTGGTVLMVGALVDDRSTKETATVAGGVTLGASAAVLAGGIVLLVTSGTDVRIAPKSPSTGSGQGSRSARAPRYWAGEF